MARRPRHVLDLTPDERARLEQLAVSDDPRRDRAAAVLACADGQAHSTIAVRLGRSAQTIAAWRARFAANRLDGLVDLPRAGRPPTRTPEGAENAILLALAGPGPDGRPWTAAAMASATGLSVRAVTGTWRSAGLAPHLHDLSGPGVDPLWHGTVRTIAGFHLSPEVSVLACWVTDEPRRRVPPAGGTPGWDDARDRVIDLFTAMRSRLDAAHRQAPDEAADEEDADGAFARFLANLETTRPASASLHLLADRPSTTLSAASTRGIGQQPQVVLLRCPGARSWAELARRAVTATTWEQHSRARRVVVADPVDTVVRWSAELLATAHHPDGAAPSHHLIRSRADAEATLTLMTRPRPRLRRRSDHTAPDQRSAWTYLVDRWAGDTRHVFPDRPHLALTHLRLHADELPLTGEDGVAALVLLTAHRQHLDLVEHTLFETAHHALVRRRDLAAALGVSGDWITARRNALRRVTTGDTGTLSMTGTFRPVPEADPDPDPDPVHVHQPRTAAEALTRLGARSLAQRLVDRWHPLLDDLDDPDHQLPDPGDYLAVTEHVCLHPYPTALDDREHEILAALLLVAHLRGRHRTEHRFWLPFCRREDVPHARLGAATGRSAAASAIDHRRLSTTPTLHSPSESTTTTTRPAAYWEPYAARIADTLRDLLTDRHRALLRRNRDLRDSIDELDLALEDTRGGVSATVVSWLLILIAELDGSDILGLSPTLTEATVPAVRLRQELHTARNRV